MIFLSEVGYMQAYDVKRKRVINVERSEGNVIIAYSLPEQPGEWYFPLIENGKNVEPYEILETEQTSMF
jgi:hypothetical protein